MGGIRSSFLLFISIALLSSSLIAQAYGEEGGEESLAANQLGGSLLDDLKSRYASDPEFKRKADDAIARWKSTLGENVSLDNLGDAATIVMGGNLNGPELGALELLKKENPGLANAKPVDDSDVTLKMLENSPKPIVLVGGPSQNRITKIFRERGWLEQESHDFYSQFVVNYGKTPGGAPVIALSDGRGYKNLPREAAAASPLAAFIPEKYVPAAATGISVSLLALPTIFAALGKLVPGYLRAFAGKYLQAVGKEGKQIKEKFLGFTLFGFRFKLREFLSIALAALVFALAVAYTFTGAKIDFVFVAIINILISLFLYFSRELARLAISHWQKLHTEFQFWLPGSLLTLFSAFLGNPCNATYYILEEKDEKGVRKSALIKILVGFATLFFAAVFFALNLLFPAPALQMFFVSASTLAAIEVLPLKPLPGTGVWKWSKPAWLVVFLIVWVAYALMNFVL